MRRFFMLLAAILLPWGAFSVLAGTYSAATLPMTEQALGTTRVCNPDGILTGGDVAQLDSLMLFMQRQKGVQSLVVVAEHFDPDDPYEFALAVGNRYGVGSQQKTGVVVVLATLDRSFWILTGSGMEQFLPDAVCRRVENRVMVPLLKQGAWGDAMVQTMTALRDVVMGESELTSEVEEDDFEAFLVAMGFMVFLAFFIWIAWYSERQKRKCPRCGQYTRRLVRRECIKVSRSRMQVTEVWRCSHCYDEEHRTSLRSSGEFYEGVFTGGTFGANPHYGGGGHSGGTTFGGFGGGSFSGGGAGGRF